MMTAQAARKKVKILRPMKIPQTAPTKATKTISLRMAIQILTTPPKTRTAIQKRMISPLAMTRLLAMTLALRLIPKAVRRKNLTRLTATHRIRVRTLPSNLHSREENRLLHRRQHRNRDRQNQSKAI